MKTTFRFSLATLLAIVAAAAIVLAALRSASSLWASVMFTASVTVLAFSLLAVIFRRDGSRAFWLGFLVFGWSYFVMVFGPWFHSNFTEYLITSKILAAGYNKIAARPPGPNGRIAVGDIDDDGWADLYVADQNNLGSVFRNAGNGRFVDISRSVGVGVGAIDFDGDGNLDIFTGSYTPARPVSWQNLQRVGHSLFTLIVGAFGGILAWFLWRTRRTIDSSHSTDH